MFQLPDTATAPFCPSEVKGTVAVDPKLPRWQQFLKIAGPGLLISVGYMDPGNWATDIQAGSEFDYALLCIVLFSSLSAMLLQTLSLRLGLVAKMDLARACRQYYSSRVTIFLWLLAELAIIACDLAEVLGSALALHLLFDISLLSGVAITAFDMLIVLGLKGHGFRQIEAIMLGLVGTIGLCFLVQLRMLGPDTHAILQGFIPSQTIFQHPSAIFLAIGILGATVMPHNLYLHSSIVQTRRISDTSASLKQSIQLSTLDTVLSLSVALLINAAILIVAASAFHGHGYHAVHEIQDAYHLLDPIVGSSLASLLFGIALLAAGQSSTFTGTIAGQVIMEGFLQMNMPCWQRRLITRAIALIPAVIGIHTLGESGIGTLLIASQVVLSLQLPFAIWPLLRFTSDTAIMGQFVNRKSIQWLSWGLFGLISTANLYLLQILMK